MFDLVLRVLRSLSLLSSGRRLFFFNCKLPALKHLVSVLAYFISKVLDFELDHHGRDLLGLGTLLLGMTLVSSFNFFPHRADRGSL